MDHVRIDEGIKRGPKRKPSDIERKARDEAGKFVSAYNPELKKVALADALVALECGARVEDIAHKHGIPVSTMYSWLVGCDESKKLRTQFFDGVVCRNLHEIRGAQEPLELARAREELSGWLKVAAVRDSSNYGPKQEIAHTHQGPLIQINVSDLQQTAVQQIDVTPDNALLHENK